MTKRDLNIINNSVILGYGGKHSKILFGKTGSGKWFIGKPKPEDLPIEEMETQVHLDWNLLLKNNWVQINHLLTDECLKRFVSLGKFSQDESNSLSLIRNSLGNKKTFFDFFYSIYLREGGWNYDKKGTVSIYWYYERMLLEQGLRDHRGYVQKMLKKKSNEK